VFLPNSVIDRKLFFRMKQIAQTLQTAFSRRLRESAIPVDRWADYLKWLTMFRADPHKSGICLFLFV